MKQVSRKSIFSGVFTNFKSFISMIYKTGLLLLCYFAVFQYVPSYESFTRKLSSSKKPLKEILTQKKLQIDVLKTFLNQLHIPKVVQITAAKKEVILVLPYLGQQSFKIQNRIQFRLRKNAPVFNFKILFMSREQLFTLFFLKDKINKMLHFNLIYKFKCIISNDSYYSKTKHHFKVRACEHLGFTLMTGKKVKSPKKNSIWSYFSYGHNATVDELETFAKESG